MPIDLRPLTAQSHDVQRGMTERLAPGSGHDLVRLIEFQPGICVRGELLGIHLAVCEERHPGSDCCDEDECFALPALRAHLEWGLGGATFTARVDFLNGTSIALVAECLKVCAEYVIWGDSCAPWLPVYRASAGVGYFGTRAVSSNPARLTELACAAAGARERIPIPPFAVSVTIQPIDDPSSPAPSPIRASVVGPRGPAVRYDVAHPLTNAAQDNTIDALPLFNGARFVEIDNTGGAGPLAAFVIFGLAL